MYLKDITTMILSNSELIFYGNILTNCNIINDIQMDSPARISFNFENKKYNLYINETLFNIYTENERVRILKHEALHILYLHIFRAKDKENKRWNYRTDIAINQQIKKLPKSSLHYRMFDLRYNETSEEYYESLKYNKEYKSMKKVCSAHSKWNSFEELKNHSKLEVESIISKLKLDIEKRMEKSRGHLPNVLDEILALYSEKRELNWKKIVRKELVKLSKEKVYSIKKRSRRFPNRIDVRGKKKTLDNIDILVVLDSSGSMMDSLIVRTLNEIRRLCFTFNIKKINLIEIDVEPQLKKFEPKKLKFNRTKNGGTYLEPWINFRKKKNINYDLVIILTDGMIENDWKEVPKKPIFWVSNIKHSRYGEVHKYRFNFNVEKYKNMKLFFIDNKDFYVLTDKPIEG